MAHAAETDRVRFGCIDPQTSGEGLRLEEVGAISVEADLVWRRRCDAQRSRSRFGESRSVSKAREGTRLARRLRHAALLSLAALVAGCTESGTPDHLRISGGDPNQGLALIQSYGCGTCHTIEGVRGAHGVVGPPLRDYAGRTLLAGIMPNAPRFLVPWLMNPPALDPETGMPNLGLSEAEARHIATYLYTLGAGQAPVWPTASLPVGGPLGIAQPLGVEEPMPAVPEGPLADRARRLLDEGRQ